MTRWTRYSAFWIVCVAALVLAGVWLVLLPSRHGFFTRSHTGSSVGLGMAMAGPATLDFDDGVKIHLRGMRLANARSPGALKIELADVYLPISTRDILSGPIVPPVHASMVPPFSLIWQRR